MTDLKAMLERRNTALANLDIEYAREMTGGKNDAVLLMALHKARYECTALADDLRNFSALWLREHRYKRWNGADLLPNGELPK